jgi:hypothetical protein
MPSSLVCRGHLGEHVRSARVSRNRNPSYDVRPITVRRRVPNPWFVSAGPSFAPPQTYGHQERLSRREIALAMLAGKVLRMLRPKLCGGTYLGRSGQLCRLSKS